MDFDSLMRRFDAAKMLRANWEAMWQQIADRVLPQMADFTSKRGDGERRTELMFDSTAALAARDCVSALASFGWPSNQQYQKLTAHDKRVAKLHPVQLAMDEWTERLFAARYSPRAAFEASMAEAALQFVVFGTGVVFIDQDIHQRLLLRYKSIHLANVYLLENSAGVVDTVFRRWEWTLRQVQQWIEQERAAGRNVADMPEKLRRRLQTHPEDKVELVHAVMPRADYEPGRLGPRGMEWASCHFIAAERHLLQEGGYRTWPFMVLRYMTSPGEVYGRSPAWLALSNIKVLNAQKRSILQAAQKVADPPLLLHEDGILGAFSMAPGALNYGGLDANGNQLVKPLVTNADVRIGIEMMDKEREIIDSAFFLNVFRALVENPGMTATQALEIMQERAMLMSPILGRIESEGFSPGTTREIALLADANQLPPAPPEMGEDYKIEYTSPARRAMRASDAIAITRTLEAVLPIAQTDQTVLDVFDMVAAAREIAEINGVPAKILRDPDAVQAMQADRQSQQQLQGLVEAAPAVSAAAANLTKLQANSGRPTL